MSTPVLFIVNNTGTDLRMFDEAIAAAIVANGVLPEELADLITLTPITPYVNRWRIDWA